MTGSEMGMATGALARLFEEGVSDAAIFVQKRRAGTVLVELSPEGARILAKSIERLSATNPDDFSVSFAADS
jgi:coenzyme F420-reducing hydrogenase beta subunit